MFRSTSVSVISFTQVGGIASPSSNGRGSVSHSVVIDEAYVRVLAGQSAQIDTTTADRLVFGIFAALLDAPSDEGHLQLTRAGRSHS